MANRLNKEKRIQVVASLVEGNSIRATCRMTGVAKGTVLSLLCDLGSACQQYQDKTLRNLRCQRIQCDEIWAFCGMKEKNVPVDRRDEFGVGSVWTWTAICADSKLVVTWLVGTREADSADIFIGDLASRLAGQVQLTTDGLPAYIEAIDRHFGVGVDYARLVKAFDTERSDPDTASTRQVCSEIDKRVVTGFPDPNHISTSFCERQNLNMRMSMRRFTRRTNAFSKKVENLAHSVSLHFMYYNFVRIHQTLRVSPAMAARVSDRLWSIGDLIDLLN